MATFNTNTNHRDLLFNRQSGVAIRRNSWLAIDPRGHEVRGDHNADYAANLILLNSNESAKFKKEEFGAYTDENSLHGRGTITEDEIGFYGFSGEASHDGVSWEELQMFLRGSFHVPYGAVQGDFPDGIAPFQGDIIPELFSLVFYNGMSVKRGITSFKNTKLAWSKEDAFLKASYGMSIVEVEDDSDTFVSPAEVHPLGFRGHKIRTPHIIVYPESTLSDAIAIHAFEMSFEHEQEIIYPLGARRYNSNYSHVKGLEDIVVSGTYSGSNAGTWFEIEIDDATEGANTFRWRQFIDDPDDPHYSDWTDGVAITPGSPTTLADGISVDFGSNTGHMLYSLWVVGSMGKPDLHYQGTDIIFADELWKVNTSFTVMDDNQGFFERARLEYRDIRPVLSILGVKFDFGWCKVRGEETAIGKASGWQLNLVARDDNKLDIRSITLNNSWLPAA